MKCTIPEISWHNRNPVLSVDIQNCSNSNGIYRLATAGTDKHVLIWQLNILDNGGVSVEMLCDLERHNRAVNAVRFAPNGNILASADDEAAIIIWKKSDDSNDIFIEESQNDNKEHWVIYKMLRGHIEDVQDLSWSSCSHYLISGSVDNSAIMWDVHKGKSTAILKDHKGFVQGVAWDPKGQMVATLSSDRLLRIFNISTKKVIHRVYKAPLSSNNSEEAQKASRLFYDDTLQSFCRRLSFSPDGELLAAPSGILEDGGGKNSNGTHVFLRSCLSRPVIYFPTHEKYTIAVRFCPQIFELRKIESLDDNENGFKDLFNLTYRMVFAVATQNAVLMYDTQQPMPFAKVSNIHYTKLSDLSWSSDGRILIASSTDGYCSLVSFAEGELGTAYLVPVVPDVRQEEKGTAKDKDASDEEPMSVDDSPPSPNQNADKSLPQSRDLKEESEDEVRSPNIQNKNLMHKEDESQIENKFEEKEIKMEDELHNQIEGTVRIQSTIKLENVSQDESQAKGENISAQSKTVLSDAKISFSSNDVGSLPHPNSTDTSVTEEKSLPQKAPDPSSSKIAIPIAVKRKPGKRIELITLSRTVDEKSATSKEIEAKQSKESDQSMSEPPSIQLQNQPSGPHPPVNAEAALSKTPRRISLITLSSPKSSNKSPKS